MTFLERYQQGEHAAVWDELVALGKGVRHELYYKDAAAVAHETMRRARHNVELLIHRLTDLGYRFVPPAEDHPFDLDATLGQMAQQISSRPLPPDFDLTPHIAAAAERVKQTMGPLRGRIAEANAAKAAKVKASLARKPIDNRDIFDPPGPQTAPGLAKLEKECGGPLPISLRAWYEVVGGVSLMGSHDVLNPEGEYTADPLVVAPLREILVMVESLGDEGEMDLMVAPDDFHKANISGGEPYSITVPDARADAPFKYEWHETTFVNYLRKAFEWGGFPGWERRKKNVPRDRISALTEGLLPI